MKKVIPPTLFMICAVLILLSTYLETGHRLLTPPISYIGIVFIVSGILMTFYTARTFARLNTEIHTFKKPRELIQQDLFKISRNPIYLGFTMTLFGIWWCTGYFIGFTGVLVFFLLSNYWYIPYEEGMMEQQFGEEYRSYKSRVRRWL